MRLPRQFRSGTFARMTAISIHELHENTDLWVRKPPSRSQGLSACLSCLLAFLRDRFFSHTDSTFFKVCLACVCA